MYGRLSCDAACAFGPDDGSSVRDERATWAAPGPCCTGTTWRTSLSAVRAVSRWLAPSADWSRTVRTRGCPSSGSAGETHRHGG